MFYTTFKLRNIKSRVTPRGPDFNIAKPVSFDLSGNVVSMRLNSHSSLYGDIEPKYVKSTNIYDANNYKSKYAVGEWGSNVILERQWRFNGPMFTGGVAEVYGVLTVHHRKLQNNETVFNPRQFEKEVCYMLSKQYADDIDDYLSLWQAPVNWQVHDALPVFSVSYNIVPKLYGKFSKEFMFPVADDCIVSLYLTQYRKYGANIEEQDALVDRSTMEQLCNDIIASVSLELSPDSKRQYEKAQQTYPNEKISQTMELLDWLTPEEKELAAFREEFKADFS